MRHLKKIISGGQTGVDQAALQTAINAGLNHGGWCPPGRICEDGLIPEQFNLKETPQERDNSAPDIPRSQRTIWNVRDSDGLLVFKEAKAQRDQGTELSLEIANKLGKPILIMVVEAANDEQIRSWLEENKIETLSVGGPSESTSPGIYEKVYKIFYDLLNEY